ncbi:ATP-dependent DNA helicase DinG [Quadrisphaera granulorum]|uniref:ATP-dependent helicase DinG n=1 Tax=Quadrisphaera granulorum TaxID=317664 RepID=A0A316A5Z5_9ACTN|nr:ATP-dependent DNA helicase [Quadrisphaera granulorum]PWJ52939.1 ATP-dependent DNA helicase DinG [Quadrisphaera granulorum]SZE97321.1 ATP-dependent DNA helicase DinG [Quadrisphaera granulorum]
MPKPSRGADPSDLLDAAVAALGGAPREGQQKMVAAVTQAVRSGRHLLVQAGTGTGKSLGYLVPLAAHAAETGTPGVVSTATLALQAQVVDRDLPRLSQALRPLLGRELTWQTVKGRAHYVCRQKLLGGFPEDEPEALPGMELVGGAERATDRRPAASSSGPSSQLGREVARLHRWAQDTETGDRDELVPGVSERAWRQVSVSSRECLGATRCPVAEECHVELARARAKEVDVVVTNHALLAIDAVEDVQLLPEHDVVVIDEAHELVDRVTSVATGSLSAAAVAQAATTARRQGGLDPTSAERLRVASDDLGAVLEDAPVGRYPRGLPDPVRLAVAGVRDAAREALSGLKGEAGGSGQGSKDDDGEAAAGKQVARAALSEVFDVAERLVEVGPAGDASGEVSADVAWLEAPGAWRRDEEPRPRVLHVAPLSVAMTLRDHLFGSSTVVLTSATLTPGGSFDAAAGALGLQGAGAPQWTALDVGSPFDHAKQGILYVAKHLPQPGREGPAPEVLEEVEQLVIAAGGRALGLFSSRRAAEAAAEALGDRLGQHGISVLCQGDDTVPNLVREFAAEPRTCLFGTLTLWQGVDVPGPSCQLVILDRIPFPRPDDPLASARAEAADRAGGNGFMAVSATHAALLLAQGAGRLLRSTSDRGVVALLDPRLATKRYGSFLRASLPPLWPTTDKDVVLGALRRLDVAASDQEAAAARPA